MKHFIFTMVAAFMMALSMNAQTATEDSKFFDNWSVGLVGGVESNLHDFNAPQGAVAGIRLNKQITPTYGLTFESLTGINNTANWLHPEQYHVHNGLAFDDIQIYALNRVNLMNLFAGYKGQPRLFEIDAFGGVGYGRGWMKYEFEQPTTEGVTSSYTEYNHNFLVKAGTDFNFNLGRTKAWTLHLTTAVVYGVTPNSHGLGLDCRNATFLGAAGVAYHFQNSNGTHHFVQHNIGALNDEINALRAENEVLKNRPAEVREVVKEVVRETTKTVVAPTAEKIIIGFAFDSVELSAEAKAELADMAKKYNLASVAAYASYEDKTPVAYNLALSEERANVICNYLKELGVTVSSSNHFGATNKESNRIAIVEFK